MPWWWLIFSVVSTARQPPAIDDNAGAHRTRRRQRPRIKQAPLAVEVRRSAVVLAADLKVVEPAVQVTGYPRLPRKLVFPQDHRIDFGTWRFEIRKNFDGGRSRPRRKEPEDRPLRFESENREPRPRRFDPRTERRVGGEVEVRQARRDGQRSARVRSSELDLMVAVEAASVFHLEKESVPPGALRL